jgi:hypothetical protein
MSLALSVLVFDGVYALYALVWITHALTGHSGEYPAEAWGLILIGGFVALVATLACVWPGWAV